MTTPEERYRFHGEDMESLLRAESAAWQAYVPKLNQAYELLKNHVNDPAIISQAEMIIRDGPIHYRHHVKLADAMLELIYKTLHPPR